MKFLNWKTFAILGALSLLFLIPPSLSLRLRHRIFALCSPSLKIAQKNKSAELSRKKLELENRMLRNLILKAKKSAPSLTNLALDKFIMAYPIYLDLKGAGHFLWVNVGDEDNRKANAPIIQKNSPVVSGRYGVGLVEDVGKKSTRIRLLSDPLLHPSIQAARGSIEHAEIMGYVEKLSHSLHRITLPEEKKKKLKELLLEVKASLAPKGSSWYFAKGILLGKKNILNKCVKGLGFRVEGEEEVKEGDILISSGLDGVFPYGLIMGKVTEVTLEDRGEPTYDFEATLFIDKCDMATPLFILPPMGPDMKERKE